MLVDLNELELDKFDRSEIDEFLTCLRLKVFIGPMSLILTSFASVEAQAELERRDVAAVRTEWFLFSTALVRAIFFAMYDSFELAWYKDVFVDM